MPQFNRVVHDYFSAMHRVCRETQERGHRRIGFLLPQNAVSKTRYLWRAAFVDVQRAVPVSACVPILAPPPYTMLVSGHWQDGADAGGPGSEMITADSAPNLTASAATPR
jgi:DNA-binding LacI/PurR family transcriptional regulator